jgi:hypothetical protein
MSYQSHIRLEVLENWRIKVIVDDETQNCFRCEILEPASQLIGFQLSRVQQAYTYVTHIQTQQRISGGQTLKIQGVEEEGSVGMRYRLNREDPRSLTLYRCI